MADDSAEFLLIILGGGSSLFASCFRKQRRLLENHCTFFIEER